MPIDPTTPGRNASADQIVSAARQGEPPMSALNSVQPNARGNGQHAVTKDSAAASASPSAQCLASLTTLPGVVVYQRVVTPDQQIRYTYISEGCQELFGASAHEILTDPDALLGRHS